MKLVLTTILVLVIAYSGTRMTFKRINLRRYEVGLFLTGVEFLLIGLIIGPGFLGIIDRQSISGLSPVIALCLGWVGLLLGLQLDWRQLKRLSFNTILIIFTESTVTLLGCSLAFLFLFGYFWPNLSRGELVISSVAIGAIASTTSPACLGLLLKHFREVSPAVHMMEIVTGLDAVPGLLALGIINIWKHPLLLQENPLALRSWLPFSVLLGLLLALIFILLAGRDRDDESIFIHTIGFLVLSAGIAIYLKLSPLFTSMIMGLTLSNIPIFKTVKMRQLLAQQAMVIYIMLLVFSGVVLRLPGWTWPMLLIIYLAVRFSLKYFSFNFAVSLFPPDFPLNGREGVALLPQGGMALAMAFDFRQVNTNAATAALLATVILSTVILQITGPYATRFALGKGLR